MSEIDDGVIKYHRNFCKTDALQPDEYWPLELWRKKLFHLKLIGEYPIVNIGYGNLSWRSGDSFVITGTQTGKWPDLNGGHYTRVLDHNLEDNCVTAAGPIDASSEALTHASIYARNININAIFHIHDKKIWHGMLERNFLATAKDTPYGTVAMAQEVKALIGEKRHGSFAMAGHEDGIISWGSTLDEAGEEILKLVAIFKS